MKIVVKLGGATLEDAALLQRAVLAIRQLAGEHQVAVVHGGQNDFIPNLGASGAIAGVLGAYLLMFPRRRVLTLIIFFFITAVYLPAFVVLVPPVLK